MEVKQVEKEAQTVIKKMPLNAAKSFLSEIEFVVVSGLVDRIRSDKKADVRAIVSINNGRRKLSVWVDLQSRGFSKPSKYFTNTTYQLENGKIRCGPMYFEFAEPDSIERFYRFASRCWDSGLSGLFGAKHDDAIG